MIDPILSELWETKDRIAREHDYDVERLAAFLRRKTATPPGRILGDPRERHTDPVAPARQAGRPQGKDPVARQIGKARSARTAPPAACPRARRQPSVTAMNHKPPAPEAANGEMLP
jgi:hypothetical protein